MNTAEMLVKTLAGQRLSPEERIELSKWIVSDKVEMLLTKEFLIAQQWTIWAVNLTLSARECTDSDSDIYKFLEVLGCKKISVSSDFPCRRAGENYEGKTLVKFRV